MVPLWLALLFALQACGASPVPVRTTRQLIVVGEGLVATNSPTLLEQPSPDVVDGALEVTYSVIFENVGSAVALLDLERAALVLDGDYATPVVCRIYGHSQRPLLSPGQRHRVDCLLRLEQVRIEELLRRGDVDAGVLLPVRYGQVAKLLVFVYRFRMEDFS